MYIGFCAHAGIAIAEVEKLIPEVFEGTVQ